MKNQKSESFWIRTITELFDVSPFVALSVLLSTLLIIGAGVVYFIRSAPPDSITISSGQKGSAYYRNATKYADILKRNGVKVDVLESEGSLENLRRLLKPDSQVDLAFVQAGMQGDSPENLVSLGSVSHQPLLVFYRGKSIDLLSQLKGKRVSIGKEGSGARNVAITLLSANGIKPGEAPTTLLDWESDRGAKALMNREIDAAFVMSDSVSLDILKDLVHDTQIKLFSFKQANAYSRKIDYLNIMELPEGGIDFGQDIPSHDVTLVGPMVELIARKSIHPAISDLILEAATEVHGRASIFQHRGEFPTPIEHGIKISEDASRFYKSGKGFFFKYLPFWLASMANRLVVVVFPLLLVLIPILRSVPALFRWRMERKLFRRYRELVELEREYLATSEALKREALRDRFDRIEDGVNRMKIPGSFADRFYGLRGHIDYVRALIARKQI